MSFRDSSGKVHRNAPAFFQNNSFQKPKTKVVVVDQDYLNDLEFEIDWFFSKENLAKKDKQFFLVSLQKNWVTFLFWKYPDQVNDLHNLVFEYFNLITTSRYWVSSYPQTNSRVCIRVLINSVKNKGLVNKLSEYFNLWSTTATTLGVNDYTPRSIFFELALPTLLSRTPEEEYIAAAYGSFRNTRNYPNRNLTDDFTWTI